VTNRQVTHREAISNTISRFLLANDDESYNFLEPWIFPCQAPEQPKSIKTKQIKVAISYVPLDKIEPEDKSHEGPATAGPSYFHQRLGFIPKPTRNSRWENILDASICKINILEGEATDKPNHINILHPKSPLHREGGTH
jgi:hypothetical protein